MTNSPNDEQLYGGPGRDRTFRDAGNDRMYGGLGNVRIVDHRGDDGVVCASGSTNHIIADRGDRIARNCRGNGSTILRRGGGR